jgi:hypothetical protein
MTRLDLSSEFYAESSDWESFPQGEVFHFVGNARGGSLSVQVARFYVSRPRLHAEGVHQHTRLDCFVSDRKLVPKPDRLARLLLTALTNKKTISEPIWLSWHHSTEIGGQAHGDLFDYG